MDKLSASRIIARRKLVSAPGKFRTRITNDAQFFNGKREGMPDVPPRYIVGTELIAPDQLENLKTKIADANKAEAKGDIVEWQDVINQSNLSAGFLFSIDGVAPSWVPTKGEIVEVFVDSVPGPNNDTEHMVLRIQSVNPIKATAPQTLDLSGVFGELPVPNEAFADADAGKGKTTTTTKRNGARN